MVTSVHFMKFVIDFYYCHCCAYPFWCFLTLLILQQFTWIFGPSNRKSGSFYEQTENWASPRKITQFSGKQLSSLLMPSTFSYSWVTLVEKNTTAKNTYVKQLLRIVINHTQNPRIFTSFNSLDLSYKFDQVYYSRAVDGGPINL